jgi:hypothetical protein
MTCKFCGRPTPILIGGMPVCDECYQDAGSCCQEFGGNDLWQRREEESDSDHPDFRGGDGPGDPAAGNPSGQEPASQSGAGRRPER